MTVPEGGTSTATDEGTRTDATSDEAGSSGAGRTDATSGKGNGDGELGDAGKRAIAAEREARAAADDRVKELEKRIAEFEDRDKSEAQRNEERTARLERERDDALERLASSELRIDGLETARSLGAKYPDAVWKLVDVADVKRDRDGKPTNLESLVSGVRDSYPDLFRARAGRGSANGGEGDTSSSSGDDGGSDMSARIRRAAGRG